MFCQIKFTQWTRDDRLRQPVFLGIREDKNATEVVKEKRAKELQILEPSTEPIAGKGSTLRMQGQGSCLLRIGSLTPLDLIFITDYSCV